MAGRDGSRAQRGRHVPIGADLTRCTRAFPCRFFSHDPSASARTLPHRPHGGARRVCSGRHRCTTKDKPAGRRRTSPTLRRFGRFLAVSQEHEARQTRSAPIQSLEPKFTPPATAGWHRRGLDHRRHATFRQGAGWTTLERTHVGPLRTSSGLFDEGGFLRRGPGNRQISLMLGTRARARPHLNFHPSRTGASGSRPGESRCAVSEGGCGRIPVAPTRRCFHLQRRDSGAPASDSTSRTSSACRDRPCLANMCFTCVRIVLSPRPVAAATSRTLEPGEVREPSAQVLATGSDGRAGCLGDGGGKRQLFVGADAAHPGDEPAPKSDGAFGGHVRRGHLQPGLGHRSPVVDTRGWASATRCGYTRIP